MGAAPKVFCTACGAENAPGTKFCKECGAKLELPAAQPAAGAERAKVFCTACGAENLPGV